MTAIDELTLTHIEMKVALLTKLHAATKAIGAIDKASENSFHHYKYASIEDIVAGTREQLLEHGLLILAGKSMHEDRLRQTNQGESTVTTVDLTFSIFDIETGYSLELAWMGRGDDPADKGPAKALTDARKTFLVQQLNIARGDDTEADTSTDERSYRSTSGTVNMVADAKGLSDAQLNRALVALGLPAAQKPFGSSRTGRPPAASVTPSRASEQLRAPLGPFRICGARAAPKRPGNAPRRGPEGPS